MTLNRINLRLKKDNPDDMEAWKIICEYADAHNCSMNKAIISIINSYSANENAFDVNAVAHKISEVLRTELDLQPVSTENKPTEGIDEEGLTNLFEFIDML